MGFQPMARPLKVVGQKNFVGFTSSTSLGNGSSKVFGRRAVGHGLEAHATFAILQASKPFVAGLSDGIECRFKPNLLRWLRAGLPVPPWWRAVSRPLSAFSPSPAPPLPVPGVDR